MQCGSCDASQVTNIDGHIIVKKVACFENIFGVHMSVRNSDIRMTIIRKATAFDSVSKMLLVLICLRRTQIFIWPSLEGR
jgi:hypothetical protein